MRGCSLLVVIILLVFIGLISIPVVQMARQKPQQTTCLSHQQQLARAIQMYVQDNAGTLFPDPQQTAWSHVVRPYFDTDANFDCPGQAIVGTSDKPEYGVNANLFGAKWAAVPSPAATVLTADLGPAGMSGNYAFTTADPTAPSAYQRALIPRHLKSLTLSCMDGHTVAVHVGSTLERALQRESLRLDGPPAPTPPATTPAPLQPPAAGVH